MLLFLLVPLPVKAEGKNYCNKGNTYEMRKCALRKLVNSDQKLKKEFKFKTFKDWLGIRQKMCEEAYIEFKEGTIYPLMVLKCSIDMNKTLLQKRKGLN